MGKFTAFHQAGLSTPEITNLRNQAKYGLNPQFGKGKVFHVNASATADGSGAVESPFKSLVTAYDACVSGRGDTIVVYPGSYALTAALVCDADYVTIVGHGALLGLPGDECAIYTAPTYTTGPAIRLMAPTNLIGLTIETRHAAGCAVRVEYDDTVSDALWCNILACRFPQWWSTTGLELYGGSHALVSGCIFEGKAKGVLMSASPTHNPAYNRIENCLSQGTARLVDHSTNVTACTYRDNLIMDSTIPFDFNANDPVGCWITGNTVDVADADVITDYANKAAALAATISLSNNHYEE